MSARSTIILLMMVWAAGTRAQETNSFSRKGFLVGVSGGFSSLHLTTSGLPAETQSTFSLPNIKIGKMVSPKTALFLYLPGSVYRYAGNGRKRERGFEGFIPAVQYWVKDRWWWQGGVGMTFDAPAFYDIQNSSERKFYFGPEGILGTGYEVWRKGKWAIDVQARMYTGVSHIPGGTRRGMAFGILVGFTWY